MVKKLPTPQLIALDLDETLLNQDSRLSQGNRAALAAAVKQGVVIAAATGRAFETVPEEVLGFTGVRYAICSNGAAVYDLLTGETLTRYQLTPEAVAHVLTVAEGENLTYEAFVDGKAYAQRDYVDDPARYMTDAATVQYVKASRCPVPDILSFIRLHPTELDSLALVVGSMAVKKRIMKKLAAVDGIYVTTSVPRISNAESTEPLRFLRIIWVSHRRGSAPLAMRTMTLICFCGREPVSQWPTAAPPVCGRQMW